MCDSAQTVIAADVLMPQSATSEAWEMVNILLIQGNRQSADDICKALTASHDVPFHVQWVKTGALGLSHLTSLGNPAGDEGLDISAILTELSLPDMSGVEFFD